MAEKKLPPIVTGNPGGSPATYDSRPVRLMVAASAAIIAIIVGFAVGPVFGTQAPWTLFLLAVVVSAWFGGLKPGLLTAAPLLFMGYYLDRSPQGFEIVGSAIPGASPLLSGLLFGLTSVVVCAAMQRLRMEQFAAQHTGSRLHDVLESTQDAILSIDNEFRCTYANARAGQIAKKAPALLYGKSLRIVFPETPAVSIYKELQRAIREHAPVRFEDRMEGANRWYEFDAYPGPSGLNLFIRDIDTRKTRDLERKELEHEQLRLESILSELPVGIIIASPDMRTEFVNQTARDLFGNDIQPGLDLKTFQRGKLRTLQGEAVDPNYAPIRQTLRTGKRVDNAEFEYLRPDGETLILIINSLPLLRADGSVRGALCTYADVTSLRRMQTALAVGEARLGRLFDSPIIGIMSGNDENILEANEAFLSIVGYSRDELVDGRLKWTELTPEGYEEMDARAIRQLAEKGFADPFEKEYVRKDGRRVPILLGVAAYDKGHWSPWIAWVLDRSEHQKLENRLREAAKLESIGLLAGGIAHDFNNILTSILGNASLAYEHTPADSHARCLLESAIQSTERAADLTRQLLAYAGKGRFVVKPTNVSSLAAEISQLIRTSIPRNVELELRLAQDVPAVLADSTQLQQLIMNLVINGAEAVGDRTGLVEVIVASRHLDAAWLPMSGFDAELPPGDYVSIEVRDNGCGMDAGTLKHVFDPFFTTKFTGRGLGLAAANGIVRAHKGGICVRSNPGNGSVFQVVLPVSREAVRPESPNETSFIPRGTGTILVVDDDGGIRNVARSCLERFGYTVLSAANGRECLDIYRGLFHSISMVILDLTMPRMSGEETMVNLLAINPKAKILLTSGFDRTETAVRFEGKGLAGFIQKPFTTTALAAKVQEILDGPMP